MANRTVMIKDIDQLIEKIVEDGFSYRQLAKEIGISQTTISLLIKGERNPSPENALKICNALKCHFNDIFLSTMLTKVNNVVKAKKKKDYEYYLCDYCGERIIVTSKVDDRTGGVMEVPIRLYKSLKLALCNKCLKPALKEINKTYETNF